MFIALSCKRCANATAALAWFLHYGKRGLFPYSRTIAMKRAVFLLPLIPAAGLVMLSGCNTVEGVGRDIERAGDAIQDEAEDTRDRRRRDD